MSMRSSARRSRVSSCWRKRWRSPLLAIAQPRKRESGSRDEIMGAEDIKYSNAVHADCDQMIILFRRRVVSKAKDIRRDCVCRQD